MLEQINNFITKKTKQKREAVLKDIEKAIFVINHNKEFESKEFRYITKDDFCDIQNSLTVNSLDIIRNHYFKKYHNPRSIEAIISSYIIYLETNTGRTFTYDLSQFDSANSQNQTLAFKHLEAQDQHDFINANHIVYAIIKDPLKEGAETKYGK